MNMSYTQKEMLLAINADTVRISLGARQIRFVIQCGGGCPHFQWSSCGPNTCDHRKSAENSGRSSWFCVGGKEEWIDGFPSPCALMTLKEFKKTEAYEYWKLIIFGPEDE